MTQIEKEDSKATFHFLVFEKQILYLIVILAEYI